MFKLARLDPVTIIERTLRVPESILSTSILSTDKISLVYDDGARRTFALREVSIEIPNKRFRGHHGGRPAPASPPCFTS